MKKQIAHVESRRENVMFNTKRARFLPADKKHLAGHVNASGDD